jgi:hypothetical protein
MFPFWAEDSVLTAVELIAAVAACLLWLCGMFGGRPAAR